MAGDEWEALGGNHPAEGELPEAVCHSLVGILGREAQTPTRCWFALWSGWGNLRSASIPVSDPGPSRKDIRAFQRAQRREEAAFEAIPQIAGVHAATGRRYFLFAGPLDAACSFESNSGHHRHPPSFWWPDDRSGRW